MAITESITHNDRISAIIEFLKSEQSNYKNSTYLSLERNITKILNLFMHKSYATIMYVLSEVRFSSQWELYKKSNLSALREINKRIADLEKLGIVAELRKDHPQFEVIKQFWRTEHPTSPEFPVLYYITESFKPVFDKFSTELRKRYIWKSTYSDVLKRQTRYDRFYENESERIMNAQKIEDEKIANCIVCRKTIPNWSKKRIDYHEYPAGHVCSNCRKEATKEQMKEWIRSNK